jgi:hypothetical protein
LFIGIDNVKIICYNELSQKKEGRGVYTCIKSEKVENYHGFIICREEDKKRDPETLETYGHTKVYYTVYDGDDMLENFKTLKDAKKWIEKIL